MHAVRNLVRTGFGTTSVRWSQLGFGRTSSTSTTQQTHRNLFGFKDGTNNLKAEDAALLDEHVWVPPAQGPAWLAGGTYLVARRIRMHVETWDRTSLAEQESLTGRTKGEGAPSGSAREFDLPDLGPGSPDRRGRAHPPRLGAEQLGGVRILRRGYNFVDGSDGLGPPQRGPVLPRVHARPAPPVRAHAERAGPQRQDDGVHRAHRVGGVRGARRASARARYWGQSLLEG